MKTFDRYVLKNLMIATVFITLVLSVIIFLTQSLRFLELVMNAGASAGAFWTLTFLALPRFFEVILPLSFIGAILFVYNRMITDSEMVVIKCGGYSPLRTARAAIILAVFMTMVLWAITMWAAPVTLARMKQTQQLVKSKVSSFLFREGVFNQITDGLMLYVKSRTPDGTLSGIIVHDSRQRDKPAATTLATRGQILAAEDGYRMLVYDGSRQEYNRESKALQRLDFERYVIQVPGSKDMRERWREPNERTIFELIHPDLSIQRNRKSMRDFKVEIHRRIVSPLMAGAYAMVACAILLTGPLSRYGQTGRILSAALIAMMLQGLFLAGSNIARQSDLGIVLMYGSVLIPLIGGWISMLDTHKAQPEIIREAQS